MVSCFEWVVRSSLAPYHTPTSHKNNYTSTKYRNYDNDNIDYKRDKHEHRVEKSRKQTRSSPERQNDVQVDARGLEDEYVSKAQRFVERNKAVIDSGAMFQMQPIVSKAKLRFKTRKFLLSIFFGSILSVH